MPDQIHAYVGTAIYYMQPILAHALVHHICNVEEMGTDRYANGAVEKCLLLGEKLRRRWCIDIDNLYIYKFDKKHFL